MIHYKELELETSADVYTPDEDSFLLADNLGVVNGDLVLDVGTGTGIQALTAAKRAAYVLGVDVNPKAVELARRNAKANGLGNVKFGVSDLFEKVEKAEMYDLIIFNPPYLPVKEKGEIAKAWSGGKDGIEVTERFVKSAGSYMKPDGKIRLLVSSLNDPDKVKSLLKENGLSFEIIARKKLFFEELYVINSRKL